MIDDDATDWKVQQVVMWDFKLVHYQLIAMNAEEADDRGIEDLTGLESAMPGLARAVQTFFRVYKVL